MYSGGGPDEPAALKAVKYDIVHFTRGAGIELGRGQFKAYPHFIGVREKSDCKGDVTVESFADLSGFKDDALDFVFAWGVTDDQLSSAEVLRMLKVGGHFIAAGNVQSGDYRYGDFDLYVKIAGDGSTGAPELAACFYVKPKGKTACVVRHGAIGDTLQAASILPALKAQGYHVSWMCEPQGKELMQYDPNIDAFLVQDRDQVPNHELDAYWTHWAKKFDRFINLCESIEGTLLAIPGRPNFMWPKELRHERCNDNYLEFTAKVAGVPFHPEHHFYPSAEEVRKAMDSVSNFEDALNPQWTIDERWKRPFIIMWALAGSAFHKLYPAQDAVIARILTEIPEAHVILVGDAACKILEQGWEDEPRVHRTSGELSIRDTLALAQRCNLVIGPETGVLNAVAFEPMSKIVLMSHSSIENLTKHWVNTAALAAVHLPCYPCHQLHYTRAHCPQDDVNRVSLCMAELHPGLVWDAIADAYNGWKTVTQLIAA